MINKVAIVNSITIITIIINNVQIFSYFHCPTDEDPTGSENLDKIKLQYYDKLLLCSLINNYYYYYYYYHYYHYHYYYYWCCCRDYYCYCIMIITTSLFILHT